MGDVLSFPSQQTQGLAHLERQMRELLLAKGADGQLIDFAIEQLTEIYRRVSTSEQHTVSINLPKGLSDEQQVQLQQEINLALETLHHQNHRLLLELVAQLVLTELKLFQHERSE